MSRAKALREWLASQDGPRTSAEIAAGTGELRSKVNIAIGDMVRSGAMTGSIEYPARYSLAANVRTWRYTDPDEKAAAAIRARKKANDNRNERNRAASALLAPQREAEFQARVAARALADAERAAKKTARAAECAQPKPKRIRAAKPKATKFKPTPVPRMRLVASQPAPVVVPLMSSAEWLAANPTHRIEVIAPGVVSERSQFKHLRNLEIAA